MKKTGAILVVIITILGWIFSVTPMGGVTLADRLNLGLDMIGGVSVVLEAQTDAQGSELKQVMEQVKAVLEKRVNEMGLSEPVIAVENENRIRIELPGAKDAAAAIESIGRTAKLSFVTADGMLAVDGSHVRNAMASAYKGYDTALMGSYTVDLEFDAEGAAAFEDATRRIVSGKITPEGDFSASQLIILLDNEVISAPMVSSVISSSQCQITGSFTKDSASNLAALIRGGSLPVGLSEIQTEIVGPTLGTDAARTCVKAGIVGILLIFVIMIAGYRVMGAVADIALALYVLMVLWIYAALGAVLTLPGIAGLILSVGMAVDSNVIIFCRIREDIEAGKTVRVAVQSGFRRAMTTIVDSQVTTVIAAVILYLFGTGSVRGFAMTLLIGIIVSLITAVAISQLLLKAIAESRLASPSAFGAKKIDPMAEGPSAATSIDFLGKRKIFYIAVCAVIVCGIGLGLVRGFNMGIDFTGGTMLQLNTGSMLSQQDVEKFLKQQGLSDFQIRYAGEDQEKILISTTDAMDNARRSTLCSLFYQSFDISTPEDQFVEQAGLIGPSVGTQLKSNAVKSCLIACAAMLVYVAFRFELRFGIAAILALCHDTLMLFAFYGIFRVQMNSPFIAGLLIVIGYSINDTIVIFDRIRENMQGPRKLRTELIINNSINQSLSRSVMTSITTLVSILPLLFMCGESIKEFALPLMAGVIFGTVSSLCIASGLYFDLCRLTKKNRYRGA